MHWRNFSKDDIVYKHFNQSDHNGLDEVRIQLIDKCSGEQQLREREAQWAWGVGLQCVEFVTSLSWALVLRVGSLVGTL